MTDDGDFGTGNLTHSLSFSPFSLIFLGDKNFGEFEEQDALASAHTCSLEAEQRKMVETVTKNHRFFAVCVPSLTIHHVSELGIVYVKPLSGE